MRKVIIEQASPGVQEIVNPNLKALRDLCPDFANLKPVRLEDKTEVLEKRPNKIGGFTYVYDDYSYRQFKADGKPADANPTGRIKLCPEMTGKIGPALGPDMKSAIASQKDKYRGYVELSSDIIGKIGTGEYKAMDLYDIDRQVFPEKNKWFLYNKVGIKTSSANMPQSIENGVNEKNLTFTQPDSIKDRVDKATTLGVEIPYVLQDKDAIAWAAKQYPGIPIGNIKVWKTAAYKEQNIDKGNCKTKIKDLAKLSVCNQKPVGRGNCANTVKKMGTKLFDLKKEVAGCLSDGKKFRQFMGIGLKSEINRIANVNSPEYESE